MWQKKTPEMLSFFLNSYVSKAKKNNKKQGMLLNENKTSDNVDEC